MTRTILLVDRNGGCAFVDADYVNGQWKPNMLSIKHAPVITGPEDVQLPSTWQSAENGLYE